MGLMGSICEKTAGPKYLLFQRKALLMALLMAEILHPVDITYIYIYYHKLELGEEKGERSLFPQQLQSQETGPP